MPLDQKHNRVAVLFTNITERKRVETELRRSEERQSFLLALGDAMRTENAADRKIEIAARHLGDRLGASRVLYAEFDERRGVANVFNGWFADGAQPFPAVMRLEDHQGDILNELRSGRTVRVDDVGPLITQPAYAAVESLGVRALLSVPLMVGERLAVNVSIHQHEPRRWSDEDVTLVQDVAERLWAEVVRARGEVALRESEERLGLAIDVGEFASWDWNVVTGEVAWNDRHYLIQGYEAGEVTPSFEA